MNKVKIPFRPFFREKMLSGVKQCTARPKQMGLLDDTFEAFGAKYKLVAISRCRLDVVKTLWKQEGCDSPEHFIEVWNSIHPRKPYDPNTWVWLHWFRRIDNAHRGNTD